MYVYSGVEYIQEGFQIEQASVLYNVVALHSQLGSHGKRDGKQVHILITWKVSLWLMIQHCVVNKQPAAHSRG